MRPWKCEGVRRSLGILQYIDIELNNLWTDLASDRYRSIILLATVKWDPFVMHGWLDATWNLKTIFNGYCYALDDLSTSKALPQFNSSSGWNDMCGKTIGIKLMSMLLVFLLNIAVDLGFLCFFNYLLLFNTSLPQPKKKYVPAMAVSIERIYASRARIKRKIYNQIEWKELCNDRLIG